MGGGAAKRRKHPRDPVTNRSAEINTLLPQTEKEHGAFERGQQTAARKKLRRRSASPGDENATNATKMIDELMAHSRILLVLFIIIYYYSLLFIIIQSIIIDDSVSSEYNMITAITIFSTNHVVAKQLQTYNTAAVLIMYYKFSANFV